LREISLALLFSRNDTKQNLAGFLFRGTSENTSCTFSFFAEASDPDRLDSKLNLTPFNPEPGANFSIQNLT
jgi:hypothetical protein